MRTTFVAAGLLSLTQAVAAQKACVSLTSLFPACALPCVTSAAAEVGCDATDLACRCEPTNSEKIQETAVGCVLDPTLGCGLDFEAIDSAVNAGASVCGCVATAAPDPTSTDPGSTPTATATSASNTSGGSGSSSSGGASSTEPSVTAPPPTSTVTASSPAESCGSASPCQDKVDAVPSCASSCILSAAQTNAGCAANDFACQCSSSAVIQSAAQNCVLSGCGPATGIQVIGSVSAICSCVTANPTTPCGPSPTGSVSATVTGGGSSSNGSGGSSSSRPGSGSEKPTTCSAATTSDCKPVASTAIPKCAQECFISAGPQVGCNSPDDYACRCQEEARASLTGIIVPCVATACDAAVLPSIIAGSEEVCKCALAPPSGGDCSTTGGGPGNGGGSGGNPKPTKSEPAPAKPTTCEAATTSDCKPVASTAVPACAQPCFSRVAPSIGCGVDEFDCYCKDESRAQLTGLLAPCVATACDSNLLPSIIAGADAVCACATAPPSGGDCGGGSGGNGGGSGPKPTQAPGGGGGSGGSNPGSGDSCKPAEKSDCSPLTTLVPECARPCFVDAGPKVGCSDPSDLACRCKPDTQASLSQILVPCVASRCDAAAIPSVIGGASSVCACVTAPPVVGGDANCPAGGGGGGPAPTEAPGGGSGGGSGGNNGGAGGSGGSPPQQTGPAVVVPGAGSRMEMSIVAVVFGTFWLAAVML